jgi:hypothetical protein
MQFDLATVKARKNITGTTQDVLLQDAINLSIELAERYCDRKFAFPTENETFTHVAGSTISLIRYPVSAIHGLAVDQMTTAPKYHLESKTGLIHFDGRVVAHEIKVNYDGGYNPIPDHLVMAFLLIFDSVWDALTNTSGGGVAAGTIESVTLNQVGTVRYASGASAAAASATGGGLIPANAVTMLDLYRREYL